MPISNTFRSDLSAGHLALRSNNALQTRRLLALVAINGGNMRPEAARLAPVKLQIVPDCMVRCDAGGPTGLIDSKSIPAVPKCGQPVDPVSWIMIIESIFALMRDADTKLHLQLRCKFAPASLDI